MARLDEEARMTIKTLARKGVPNRETARLLGTTEGAVRYQLARMTSGDADGRASRTGYGDAYAEAIAHWRASKDEEAINLTSLHEWIGRTSRPSSWGGERIDLYAATSAWVRGAETVLLQGPPASARHTSPQASASRRSSKGSQYSSTGSTNCSRI